MASYEHKMSMITVPLGLLFVIETWAFLDPLSCGMGGFWYISELTSQLSVHEHEFILCSCNFAEAVRTAVKVTVILNKVFIKYQCK